MRNMNDFRFLNDSCEIETVSRKLGLVLFKIDLIDHSRVKSFKWHPFLNNGNIYCRSVFSYFCDGGIKYSHILLHRLITSFSGAIIDHADNNTLNNTLSNLRIVTHSQNNMNKKISSLSTSGFKGVSYRKDIKKFRASIRINGSRKHLGNFESALVAAREYNKAAAEIFGEFALLNAV